MNSVFNLEEMNIIDMYNGNGKVEVIENIKASLPYMTSEAKELSERVISKLHYLSDEEYVNILIEIFSRLDFLVIGDETPKEKVLQMR